jgi:Tol biopolymer transport system component
VVRRIFLTAILLGAAASAAGASAARAAFPGANGLIAFNTGKAPQNVYTVGLGGGGLKQLTTDGHSLSPRWSADGKLIAFSRLGNIWVMNANGTNQHQVTTGKHAFQPAFSPNGKTIIFVHVPTGQPGQIWSVPVTGGAGKLLVSDAGCGDAHPVYSPLGTMIAYDQTGCTTTPRVVIYRLATKVEHVIADSVNPDFTSDGTHVLFSSDDTDYGTFSFDAFTASVNGTNISGPITLDDCVDNDPCFTEASALPTSTGSGILWLSSISDPGTGANAQWCFKTSNVSSFCKLMATFPAFPQNLDVQPRP